MLEKESRMRESMKMMGLSNWILWVTWYIKQFLFLMITVVLMAILIKVMCMRVRVCVYVVCICVCVCVHTCVHVWE